MAGRNGIFDVYRLRIYFTKWPAEQSLFTLRIGEDSDQSSACYAILFENMSSQHSVACGS